jgi:glycosyltransferase involved in cell wall biosynthesis
MDSSRPIRALHVFPLFGPDLPNGSERYAYLLTKELVRAGVHVDVFTTCARRIVVKDGFSLQWPNECAPGISRDGDLRIERFPTNITTPASMGRLALRQLLKHVARRQRKLGPQPEDGSPLLPMYQHQAMAGQSRWSDWLGIASRGPLSLPLWSAVWRRLPHYDVVLVSFFPLFSVPAVVHLARARNKPAVVLPLFHANDLPNNSPLLGRSLVRASAVLTLTEHSTTHLAHIYPGIRNFQVGAGVDPSGLDDSRISGPRFRAKYGLGDSKLILFAGRKEPGKRYQVAIDAVNLLSDPGALLVMVGEDVDGVPIAGERVRYLGWVSDDDLWDAFDACDVFILPSRFESFGLVFLQAWIRGKPVIGDAGCPAVCSLIEDGVDGFLCGDVKSAAMRLESLLADPTMRTAMGEAGRRKVLRNYTWEAVAGKVRSVYEGLR